MEVFARILPPWGRFIVKRLSAKKKGYTTSTDGGVVVNALADGWSRGACSDHGVSGSMRLRQNTFHYS